MWRLWRLKWSNSPAGGPSVACARPGREEVRAKPNNRLQRTAPEVHPKSWTGLTPSYCDYSSTKWRWT
jgi:hypothetical protein